MSDPHLPDIDFKNEMALIWTTLKPDRNSVVYSLLCSNFSIFTIKFFMVRGIRSLIRPIITPLTFESFFIRVHRHVTSQVGTCCPCIITVVAFEFSNFQMFCVHMLAQLCLDIFIVTVRVFTFNFCMFSFDMIIEFFLSAQHDNLAGWTQMTCERTMLVIVNVEF